jgi:hypothetical protein
MQGTIHMITFEQAQQLSRGDIVYVCIGGRRTKEGKVVPVLRRRTILRVYHYKKTYRVLLHFFGGDLTIGMFSPTKYHALGVTNNRRA